MDLPAGLIQAHGPLLEDLESVPLDATAVCAVGRAKALDRLGSLSSLRRLWLSGVVERTSLALPPLASLRELVVHDFRAPSLTAIPNFPQLEMLAVCGSPKLKSLEGLQRYRGLQRLILCDCCNYRDLSPLRALPQLRALCLEGGFSKPLHVDTLEALSGLFELRELRLASIRVTDRSLQPLERLRGITSVFIAATFPQAELRRLAMALPDARGEFLDAARRHEAG
jgi:hypothetical protein